MKKLLIIDDQQQYLDSLTVYLKKKFDVITANSYTEALDKLKLETDIALIDIRLDEKDEKNIDGLKILEWIKMNRPEISICYECFP